MKNKRVISGCLAMFFVLIGLSGARGASVATLPESENFQQGELPHDVWHPPRPPFILFGHWTYSPWNFTTNGEARTSIAYDETDSDTSSLPWGWFIAADKRTSTGGSRSKGNYFQCEKSGVLASQSITLSRASTMDVTFMVYESTTSNGTYSVISSNVVSAVAGSDAISSGSINIPFVEGRFYLVAAGWNDSATYTYLVSGYQPMTTSFGESFSGYSGGFPFSSSVALSSTDLLYFQSLEFSTNAVYLYWNWELG